MLKKEQTSFYDEFIDKIYNKSEQELERFDNKRMKRLLLTDEQHDGNENDYEDYLKLPFQMHKFREDARRNQRQFSQQNHEFMKISSSVSKSIMDQNRFDIPIANENSKKNEGEERMVHGEKILKPCISLKLKTQFSSSLSEQKFEIKQLYEMTPFKKQSVELEPNLCRHPDHEFFFFKTSFPEEKEMEEKMREIIDDGLADIKEEIAVITHYTTFLDIINFVHYLHWSSEKDDGRRGLKYPDEIVEMAKLNRDGASVEESFNKDEILVDKNNLFNRIFQCDEKQLSQLYDSIYFKDLEDLQSFKKERLNQFKNMKIDCDDIFINTDVRKIISSEKIYIINIIEEVKLLVKLVRENKETYLYDKIHEKMINKIDEYMRLICGYTKSNLLFRFNVNDPYSKIYTFLKKSILYNKPYRNVTQSLIKRFPIIDLWYNLPEKLFGYPKEFIHETLYELIAETIEFEKKIAYQRNYDKLKEKHIDRKYQPQEK